MLISVGYADERGIIPYHVKNENNLIKNECRNLWSKIYK